MQKITLGCLFLLIASTAMASRPAPSFRFFQPVGGGTAEEDFARWPKTMSATGFFSDIAAKVPGSGAYAFEINSPLWSDGAGKSRFLILPENTVVTYVNDSDEFAFPEGAVFVKHFFFDGFAGGVKARTYIETRILVHQTGIWHGFGYKWRKDQSDADLVGALEGHSEADTFSIADAADARRAKKWLFPGRKRDEMRSGSFASCNSCHLNRAVGRKRGVLGFITPQLSRLANGKDQILDLVEKGYLVVKNGSSYDPAAAHRWYALDDSAGPGSTLEKRARSYLASNCSHCHSTDGNATCVPIYSYNSPRAHVNYIGRLSMGKWGLQVPISDSAKWINPGKPQYSVLLRRMEAADADGYRDTSDYGAVGWNDNPGFRLSFPAAPAAKRASGPRALAKTAGWDGTGRIQMPPVGTYEVDPLANRVIRAWIENMPAGYTGATSLRGPAAPGAYAVRLSGGAFRLPEFAQTSLHASLSDVRGATILLSALRPGIFAVPAGLKSGVYCLTAGGRRFIVPYFPMR